MTKNKHPGFSVVTSFMVPVPDCQRRGLHGKRDLDMNDPLNHGGDDWAQSVADKFCPTSFLFVFSLCEVWYGQAI